MSTLDAIVVALLAIAVKLTIFWCAISLGVSFYKSVTDQCTESYSIEKVVEGNWLCPVKKVKENGTTQNTK